MIPVDRAQILVMLVLFGLNFAVGLAIALKDGNFEAAKLADILGKRILPYGLGYIVMGWLVQVAPDWAIVQGITFAGIVAAMASHIYQQVCELLGLPNIVLLKKVGNGPKPTP